VPGPLELKVDDAGKVHLLDHQALQSGERVELLLADGRWIDGTYEWSGSEVRWPSFRFALGGDAPPYSIENRRTAAVALPPDAVLRRCTCPRRQ
jgi:hypothetical protein